jgi:hypothetical protein
LRWSILNFYFQLYVGHLLLFLWLFHLVIFIFILQFNLLAFSL